MHQRGYLTAASVMTNFPAHRHALDLLRDCPELDLGIHLALTDGHPVTAFDDHHPHLLNEDFSFRSNISLYIRSHFFSAGAVDWIRRELDAQMRRFTDVGLQPQHISSHHHFHAIPLLRRIVHELAEQYQVDWVRGSRLSAPACRPATPFLRAQRNCANCAFAMPDYMTAIQSHVGARSTNSARASPTWRARSRSSCIPRRRATPIFPPICTMVRASATSRRNT